MSFVVFLLLFVVLSGWLDARIGGGAARGMIQKKGAR